MKNIDFHSRPLGWLRSACWIFVSTVLLASCEKPALAPSEAPASGPSLPNTTGNIANPNNPFSLKVMQQAYDSLRARQASKSTFAKGPSSGPMQRILLDATHQYVRFLASNTDQVAALDSAGFELSWEPLDETVAASTPVDFTSNSIPWVYTVVPYGTILPSEIQAEVIQDLYLFDEDEGDIQDEPYTPPPACRPQWDPVAQRPLPCPQKQAPVRSILREATEKLKRAGASPQELYNEAMHLSHHEDEMIMQGTAQARTTSTRYYPSGTIQVEETQLGRNVPVRGVRVKSRRWFKYGSTYTNASGQFYINTGYRSKARIFVEFKNSLATTRGFINSFKFWEAVLPIKYGLGLFTRTGLQNINGTFSYQFDQHSVGARAWVAATLFNTLADAQNFSAARAIPGTPPGINVWLMPDPPKETGAAPMLRYIASTSVASQLIDYLLIGSGLGNIFLAKQILQRQLPDVVINYFGENGGTAGNAVLSRLIFHELGHTQHYAQVGNSFWAVYIGYIVNNLGYGQKTSSGSGRVAISEAWGNYVGSTFTSDRYRFNDPIQADREIGRLENQMPADSNPELWIVYGMLHDMTDATEPFFTGVADNVDAYNTAQVFQGLQPNVSTVRDYKTQVLSQNNQLQSSQFDQLITSYRW
jgi:hypothetical protein